MLNVNLSVWAFLLPPFEKFHYHRQHLQLNCVSQGEGKENVQVSRVYNWCFNSKTVNTEVMRASKDRASKGPSCGSCVCSAWRRKHYGGTGCSGCIINGARQSVENGPETVAESAHKKNPHGRKEGKYFHTKMLKYGANAAQKACRMSIPWDSAQSCE